MANFSVVRKGYDINQVDAYVNKVVTFTESKLEEQKKRIDELKEENRLLQSKIDDYKKSEETVSEALINATKKANEIITASKMRFALEGERIRLFRAKWTQYVESAVKKIRDIDESVNMQAYLIKTEDEMREAVGRDLNIKKTRLLNEAEDQFMRERLRLNKIEEKAKEGDSLKTETKADKVDKKDFTGKVKKAIKNNIKKEIKDYEEKAEEEDLLDDEEMNDEFVEIKKDVIKDEKMLEIDMDDSLDKPLPDLLQELGLIFG